MPKYKEALLRYVKNYFIFQIEETEMKYCHFNEKEMGGGGGRGFTEVSPCLKWAYFVSKLSYIQPSRVNSIWKWGGGGRMFAHLVYSPA